MQGDATAAEEGLGLTRWETRFSSADTEVRYRAWHVEQAVPFNRAGLFASVANWLTALAACWWLGVMPSWLPLATLFILLVIACGILTTYRRSLRHWMLPSAMVANSLAGLIGVCLMNPVDGQFQSVFIESAMGVALLINYFGFAILRARPAQAAVAVAPYMLLQGVLKMADLRKGDIGTAAFGLDVLFLAMGFITGFMISIVLDISSRRAYRQERIIESQKETIARERARSEALLKSELGHQVAERSRELGDALARVGAPAAVARPAPGDRFNARYRVVRALGEGAMGAVFEVERLTDTQRLALKLVTGQVSAANTVRFAREAEIGARVHHRNLISIVDVGVAEAGAPFLVMELVQGGSLEDQRARFGDVAWGLPILRQIALGLCALHEAGVIHRDLKPGNVLLDGAAGEAAPVAKISDFGISRFGELGDGSGISPEANTLGAAASRKPNLTGTGALLGTPYYMAPEAARGGRSVDAAADMFAFGILAYEVLTGRPPFGTPPVLAILTGQPIAQPAPMHDGGVDGAAREVVLTCLALDPRRRPSARRVCEALGAS